MSTDADYKIGDKVIDIEGNIGIVHEYNPKTNLWLWKRYNAINGRLGKKTYSIHSSDCVVKLDTRQ